MVDFWRCRTTSNCSCRRHMFIALSSFGFLVDGRLHPLSWRLPWAEPLAGSIVDSIVGQNFGRLAFKPGQDAADGQDEGKGKGKGSHSSAQRITANTTAGAVKEVFFAPGMRRNVLLGIVTLSIVVIFEIVHKRSSGVDLKSRILGMDDVREERCHGVGPFRGAMRLWASYVAEDRVYAFNCVAMIIALLLMQGFAGDLLMHWTKGFWDKVAEWAESETSNNVPKLNATLMEFLFFAFLLASSSVYVEYVISMFKIRVRGILTYKYTGRWLSDFSHYHLLLPGLPSTGARNPDQRIQEDVAHFADHSLNLATGIFSHSLQIWIFGPFLYENSPEYVLGVAGIRFPGWLLYICLFYSMVATILVHAVAWQLEPLSYYKQRVEADFRWELASVRRHAENIAVTRGEELQQERTRDRFELIRRCIWETMMVRKRYSIVLGCFDQVETFASFLFLGPPFLKGQITLGVVMAGQRAINRVVGSTMYFAHAYHIVVGWRASTARLLRFGEAMDDLSSKSAEYVFETKCATSTEYVSCRDLTIWKPGEVEEAMDDLSKSIMGYGLGVKHWKDWKEDESCQKLGDARVPARVVLFDRLNFSILPGQKVLFAGPSGKGKTSFVRALFGAWPFVEGQVTILERGTKSLCFPSEAYLPQGQLRSVVAYPMPSDGVDDVDIEKALRAVGLDILLHRGLDNDEDWNRALSDGQKARISFARLVLHKPTFAAMDEPLAHLDEASRTQVLNAVSASLSPDASLFVVHHGMSPGIRAFFNVQYRLDAERKSIVTAN